MARPAKVLGGVAAVGSAVLMAWLAGKDIPLAWLALVAFGVVAIAWIVVLAYLVRRDPMAAVRKASKAVQEAAVPDSSAARTEANR